MYTLVRQQGRVLELLGSVSSVCTVGLQQNLHNAQTRFDVCLLPTSLPFIPDSTLQELRIALVAHAAIATLDSGV